MYTVTFYSFKGGVGRTMALVNMATKLAMTGKRVLIVDFDLEAPGIPTFSLTAPKTESKGLVEYICEYRHSGEAPAVQDFTYSANKFEGGGEIIVMPAGRHDASYSSRLNSIDWRALYDQEDGYLFFEDLKSQWNQFIFPDYVLIDSRTGHSDVEGICTRQLPDAVCLLFFPNDQNLQGLKRVVANVRAQNKESTRDAISMHFVVSNVPDLDDEEGIIKRVLDNFKKHLGYESITAEIHHYNSLSLLGQEIFVQKRPKSRLAKEYESLVTNVIKENFSDRDVSIRYLERAAKGLHANLENAGANSVTSKVDKILKLFPSDNRILVEAAQIYESMGLVADALALMPDSADHANAYYYAVRARIEDRLSREADVSRDLWRMLEATGAEAFSLMQALSVAGKKHLEIFSALPKSNAFNSLSLRDRKFITIHLEGGKEVLRAKAEIYDDLLAQDNDSNLSHDRAMVNIGLGKFDEAIRLILENQESEDNLTIERAFNLAMAKLGRDGHADKNLFGRVVFLAATEHRDIDANFLACLAIAYAAIDRPSTAIEYIERSQALVKAQPRREFSPWTYSKVPPNDFLQHLDALKAQISQNRLQPEFCDAC